MVEGRKRERQTEREGDKNKKPRPPDWTRPPGGGRKSKAKRVNKRTAQHRRHVHGGQAAHARLVAAEGLDGAALNVGASDGAVAAARQQHAPARPRHERQRHDRRRVALLCDVLSWSSSSVAAWGVGFRQEEDRGRCVKRESYFGALAAAEGGRRMRKEKRRARCSRRRTGSKLRRSAPLSLYRCSAQSSPPEARNDPVQSQQRSLTLLDPGMMPPGRTSGPDQSSASRLTMPSEKGRAQLLLPPLLPLLPPPPPTPPRERGRMFNPLSRCRSARPSMATEDRGRKNFLGSIPRQHDRLDSIYTSLARHRYHFI